MGGATTGRDSGVPMRDMSICGGAQVHHYQCHRRLRSFWGAARISGLSPDSPPLFRRAKTPWSIRIHIEFDPFIHLPFSCCLGALCVCALQDNSPPASPVFPPCDDHFTASPAPITIIPFLPVVTRRCPTSNEQHSHRLSVCLSIVCLLVCLAACLVSSSRLSCTALRCDGLTALGRQSYCRHLLPSFLCSQTQLSLLSALRLQTFPTSKKTTSPRPLDKSAANCTRIHPSRSGCVSGLFYPVSLPGPIAASPIGNRAPARNRRWNSSISSGHNAVHHHALGSLNQQVHLDPDHHLAHPSGSLCRYRSLRSTSVTTVPLAVLPQFLASSRKISGGNTSTSPGPRPLSLPLANPSGRDKLPSVFFVGLGPGLHASPATHYWT